jgi:hypothetical protein
MADGGRIVADDWEVIATHTHRRFLHICLMILQGMLLMEPMTRSRVTWTVRRRGTGVIRQVTAGSEQDAIERIRMGLFDQELDTTGSVRPNEM